MLATTTAGEGEQECIGEEYQVERQQMMERSEQSVALAWWVNQSHSMKEICVLLPSPPKAGLPTSPSHDEPSDHNPSRDDPSDRVAPGSTIDEPSDRKPTQATGSAAAVRKPACPDPATASNSDFAIAE
jgi:hypothetical protein